MHSTTSPARRPDRSAAVIATEGQWFLLELTVGKKLDYYLACKLPSDYGQAYVLERQDGQGTAEVYHVCLDGRCSTCDCPGHCFRGHCKHREALQALAARGKLPGYRSPSLVEVNARFRPGRDDEPEENIFHDTRRCGCRSSEEHELCCLLPMQDAEYNAAVA